MTHNNTSGSQYLYSTGTQLYWTACDDKLCVLRQSQVVKCHVKHHCTEKSKSIDNFKKGNLFQSISNNVIQTSFDLRQQQNRHAV